MISLLLLAAVHSSDFHSPFEVVIKVAGRTIHCGDAGVVECARSVVPLTSDEGLKLMTRQKADQIAAKCSRPGYPVNPLFVQYYGRCPR